MRLPEKWNLFEVLEAYNQIDLTGGPAIDLYEALAHDEDKHKNYNGTAVFTTASCEDCAQSEKLYKGGGSLHHEWKAFMARLPEKTYTWRIAED